MILRTEYDFRRVFGPMGEMIGLAPPVAAIADEGCWGHVPFAKGMEKAGKRAVLGRRVRWGDGWAVVLPRNPDGLRALYALPPGPLDPTRAGREAGWYVLVPGPLRGEYGPRVLSAYVPGVVRRPVPTPPYRGRPDRLAPPTSGGPVVAFSDNLYPRPGDREAWALMLGREANGRPGPQHLLDRGEMIMEGATEAQLDRMTAILDECVTPLPKAENIHWPATDPQRELETIARRELKRRGLDRSPYRERLARELATIKEKHFADYFLVIADLINYAKGHMLVGPARGSSCGSLACWLLRITEVDPIRHGLLFERFIDLNRADLPDIDIDFADAQRHLILAYLGGKYGEANVAQLGTIMRYKPKSALTDVAKHGGVPLWELDKLKDVMIERSSGDMRYRNQLSDSFEELDVGKDLLARYPVLATAGRLEDHARSAGTHAAGIVVCNRPITEYCAVEKGGAQIDKKMAEDLNMLKIDALGLRTLSVIDECCELIGRERETLYDLPLDDESVFSLLNQGKFGCVFQFAGIALQTVARQVKIDCFSDIAAITALARPGPLSGGETQRWVRAKTTNAHEYLHPALAPYTGEERGCIIYQEQVMRVCRELGNFSWADTAAIRRLMSKTLGNEAFAKFGVQFKDGAAANGVSDADSSRIWKAINQMGSWSFNKSHAVAYGIVSYWTAWLKVHHPVEFAVSNLRHAIDDDGARATLRELMREGTPIEFRPVDAKRSTDRWEFDGKALLGPLTGIKGIGAKTAREIIVRRENGTLKPRHKTLLSGVSKFEDFAPTHKLWGHLYADPAKYFKTVSIIDEIEQLTENPNNSRHCVIGRLLKKNLKSKNDEKWLAKRNGRRVPDSEAPYLIFNIEDDSGQIPCCITNAKYQSLGKRIVEEAKLGAWFAVVGSVPEAFTILMVENVRWL